MCQEDPDRHVLGLDSLDADEERKRPMSEMSRPVRLLAPGMVVQAKDVTSPETAGAIRKLELRALATGQVSAPVSVEVNRSQTLAVVSMPLKGKITDDASNRALDTLRDEVIPATGLNAQVTGATAQSRDFNDLMKSRAPLVFVFVLAMAFVLLLLTFRSIVIPIKAIALNLLSVGASYGVMVLVFQHGYGESLLGFESSGAITPWLPLFMFVILFGLSMDYHVFILSRIREAFDQGASSVDAVRYGIKSTAGVVTSAAIVMIGVFSIFALLRALEFKQMGVGLAVAVLIDATIVRGVLLPATNRSLSAGCRASSTSRPARSAVEGPAPADLAGAGSHFFRTARRR
jgi:putative drug exporter of the RND superfamily